MYVDSHCHLEIEDYNEDRWQVIEKSLASGLDYMLTVGTDETYFDLVDDITARYAPVYGAVGIHPHNAAAFDEGRTRRLEQALRRPKTVALGEIGLDFFRNRSPAAAQKRAFEAQLDLAAREGLPVIIHSRDAKKETLEILRAWADRLSHRGVIHCYSYDPEYARKFLDLGFFISIPGTITYKKNTSLEEVVRLLPPDRILSETDAPFLSPVPYRGKRNLPEYVKITVERIAGIRNAEIEAVAGLIRNNFIALFLEGREGARQ